MYDREGRERRAVGVGIARPASAALTSKTVSPVPQRGRAERRARKAAGAEPSTRHAEGSHPASLDANAKAWTAAARRTRLTPASIRRVRRGRVDRRRRGSRASDRALPAGSVARASITRGAPVRQRRRRERRRRTAANAPASTRHSKLRCPARPRPARTPGVASFAGARRPGRRRSSPAASCSEHARHALGSRWFATTKSCSPSPLTSPVATATGPIPGAELAPAPEKLPPGPPTSTRDVVGLRCSATARSRSPSRVKSAAATRAGASPRGEVAAAPRSSRRPAAEQDRDVVGVLVRDRQVEAVRRR